MRKAAPHLCFVGGDGKRNELLFLRRTPVDSDHLHFLLSCFPHSRIRLPPSPPIFLINEEGRKAGKQRPTAPLALRVEQSEKARIIVPEEPFRKAQGPEPAEGEGGKSR